MSITSAFNQQKFNEAIQRIVDNNPNEHEAIYEVLLSHVDAMSANDPMRSLVLMGSNAGATDEATLPKSARQCNGVTTLTYAERNQIKKQIVQVVTREGAQPWLLLREKVLCEIPWVKERQSDPEATLRGWCGNLVKSGELEYLTEPGKNGGPRNETVVALPHKRVEGDAAPLNGSGRAHAGGTRNAEGLGTAITLDGGSQEVNTKGAGAPNHPLNGFQNEPNTLALIDHNSASAGQ